MKPEEDPRYLAPVSEFVPRGETSDALEAQIQQNGEMLATFSTMGWRYIKSILEDRQQAHLDALTKVNGAQDLNIIYGLRQGLALMNEMLSLEDLARDRLKHDSEMLNKLRNREGK